MKMFLQMSIKADIKISRFCILNHNNILEKNQHQKKKKNSKREAFMKVCIIIWTFQPNPRDHFNPYLKAYKKKHLTAD